MFILSTSGHFCDTIFPWKECSEGITIGNESMRYPAVTFCQSAPSEISVIFRFRVILGIGANTIWTVRFELGFVESGGVSEHFRRSGLHWRSG